MNRRLAAAALALGVLALLGGCLGGGSISDDRLDADPAEPYAWNESVDAHLTIQDDAKFRAVYRLNETEMELYRRDGFGGRNPLSVESVQYRYPNGTVIEGTEIERRNGTIDRNRDRVLVALPADAPPGGGGKLAFTADSTPKRFTLPVFVEGSYEVVLPPNRRVEMPVFGSVSPGGYAAERIDEQTHITWDEVTGRSVIVQFYLQRDLYIFGGITAVLVVIGLAGLAYYRRKIEALKRQREELGLDVEKEDDDDEFRRGPPPGMR